MNVDLLAASEGHRALLGNLILLYDRSGEPVTEMAVAEITRYQHPVDGRLTPAPIVAEADGSTPDWLSRMFDELAVARLIESGEGSRAGRTWRPLADASARLAAARE